MRRGRGQEIAQGTAPRTGSLRQRRWMGLPPPRAASGAWARARRRVRARRRPPPRVRARSRLARRRRSAAPRRPTAGSATRGPRRRGAAPPHACWRHSPSVTGQSVSSLKRRASRAGRAPRAPPPARTRPLGRRRGGTRRRGSRACRWRQVGRTPVSQVGPRPVGWEGRTSHTPSTRGACSWSMRETACPLHGGRQGVAMPSPSTPTRRKPRSPAVATGGAACCP